MKRFWPPEHYPDEVHSWSRVATASGEDGDTRGRLKSWHNLRNKFSIDKPGAVMEHSEAVQRKATERYLLGELSADQRDAFEEHFFDCSECSADVKATAIFIDNARAALREMPVPARALKPARKSFSWAWLQPSWGLAAAAVILAVFVYQNLVSIPRMKTEIAANSTPQALTSVNFVTAGSRGAGGSQPVVPADKPFSLYVDIPARDSFAYYSAAVEMESGGRKFAVPVSREQAKESVQILLPAKTLSPGNYVLVIRGAQNADSATGMEVARYPFVVQRQQ